MDTLTPKKAAESLLHGEWSRVICEYAGKKLLALEQEVERLKAERDETGALRDRIDGGWISVEDRLPEKNEQVLAYYVGIYSGMGFTQVLTYYANDDEPHFQHMLGETSLKVTHWQPLPAPPKMDEQEGANDD